MAKKTEVQKLAGWWKGSKELMEPPLREERGDVLRQAEVPTLHDEPEEQYNIRIRRSLKKRLKLKKNSKRKLVLKLRANYTPKAGSIAGGAKVPSGSGSKKLTFKK